MFFASIGAVALGQYDEAAAVVFLFASSEFLELRATSRARRALSAIVDLRPDVANLVHPVTQDVLVVPATAVPVGFQVVVRVGDKIPCDGLVVAGESSVNESSLTGESRPVRKTPGSQVFGGTVNSGLSPLMIRTTSTSDDSAVARLIKLVEEAQANRSETEKLVEEFAKVYTVSPSVHFMHSFQLMPVSTRFVVVEQPVVVFSAILMVSIPWAFGNDLGKKWTEIGLILLVVACPCALIISTPVTYVAGLAATAQNGILVKGGARLEALGLVGKVFLDKTGTLSEGNFQLIDLQVIGAGLSREEVFQHLVMMEQPSSHPIAQAVVAASQNERFSVPDSWVIADHAVVPGEGVSGIVNDSQVYVGNERMFRRLGLLDAIDNKYQGSVEKWKSIGGTIGFMSVQGFGIVCAFCVCDSVREESLSAVSALRRMGMEIKMLTGDNRSAASVVGKQVKIDESEIESELLPEDKLEFVRESITKRKGTSVCNRNNLVLFVGDGVNDAPALALADVGVAIGSGAEYAMETADVTLLDSNLGKLVFSIQMGRRVLRKIKENIAFSVGIKLVVLFFTLLGHGRLWAAIATDVGAMLLVTLNSMRLIQARAT
jgi:Zn2+/Cd2+-exporting ATPase